MMGIDCREKVPSRYRRDLHTSYGQSVVEYAVFIGLVVIISVGVLGGIGTSTSDVFVDINSGLSQATIDPLATARPTTVRPTSRPATMVPATATTVSTALIGGVIIPTTNPSAGAGTTVPTAIPGATTVVPVSTATAPVIASATVPVATTVTLATATLATTPATATATSATPSVTATSATPSVTATSATPSATATSATPSVTATSATPSVTATSATPSATPVTPTATLTTGQCRVPNLIGLTQADALTAWTDAGFTGTFDDSGLNSTDIVASQTLPANSVETCNTAQIVVDAPLANGQCRVPNLIGKSRTAANTLWTGANFTGNFNRNNMGRSSIVEYQSLVAGSRVACSSSITVAPANCTVPDFSGERKDAAIGIWTDANFIGTITLGATLTSNSSTIRAQTLVKDTQVPCNSSITVSR